MKVYKTIILPGVLYVCETWLLTLREESWLMILKTGFLGEYLGPKGMIMGSGEGFTMRNLMICTIH